MKTLGLDLGTNSLGWAIIEDQKIVDAGDIIFEEGIRREKGKDSAETPAAERRRYRMGRRLKFRRRLRKIHTLKILIENGMCPLSMEELNAWKNQNIYPVANSAFIDWLHSSVEKNPYFYRAQAAERKLSPFDVGRAIYHLAQRRGFKSSRKDVERESSSDEQGMKGQIAELSKTLKERQLTLGQYFYNIYVEKGEIRRRHIGRADYENEFETISACQALAPELHESLKNALFFQRPLRSCKGMVGKCTLEPTRDRCMIAHPLFEEFRMLSFINNITVTENGVTRPLSADERRKAGEAFFVSARSFDFERIMKKVFPRHPDIEWNFRKDQSVSSSPISYALKKIIGDGLYDWHHPCLSKKGTARMMDYQVLIDALSFFDDDKKLFTFAKEKAGFNDEQAADFIKIHLPQGYANYSLYALKKIIPFLRDGYRLPQAVFFAKLPDVFGAERFEQNRTKILDDLMQIISDYQEEKRLFDGDVWKRAKFLSLTNRLKQYFEDTWKIMPDQFATLYRHSDTTGYPDSRESGRLPAVNLGMQYNPACQRALTILRRLVNYLRQTGKIDESTEIHVELARSVNDRNHRIAYEEYQKKREKEREEAKQKIAEYHLEPTDDLIRRYLLWEEQKHLCLYTGKQWMKATDVFNGDCDIEHTIPRSRSGDDSMSNNTLCDSTYNRQTKIGKLPCECDNYQQILENLQKIGWFERVEECECAYRRAVKRARSFAGSSPEKHAKARQDALVAKMHLDYWRTKVGFFTKSAEELEQSFFKRQLVDSGIIARHAVLLLRSVYPATYARNGQVVAWARKVWGLQGIYEKKDRTDHTHHVVDAITIAALKPEAFRRISAAFHEDEIRTHKIAEKLADKKQAYPWPNFPKDVYEVTENVLVKHLSRHNEMKQTLRNVVRLANPIHLADGRVISCVPSAGDTVRGQLHKETNYGKIQMPGSGENCYVLRKLLSNDNFSKIEDLTKIVDRTVREVVIVQIQARINAGKSFKEAIAEPVHMRTKTGNFDGPVVRKVRCLESVANPLIIRKQTFSSKQEYKNFYYAKNAEPRYYLIALYRGTRGYKMDYIDLWDWASNHKKTDYVSPEKRSDFGTFVGFTTPGSLALIYKNEPNELRTMSSKDLSSRMYRINGLKGDGRMTLVHHREARSSKDLKQYLKSIYDGHCAEGKSELNFPDLCVCLYLSQSTIEKNVLFEGIDFDITLDGKISFKDRA